MANNPPEEYTFKQFITQQAAASPPATPGGTVTKAQAAQESLLQSASALAELPGTIRRGGEARKKAAEMGAAQATGAALRRGGTGALTSGAAVGAVADVGAKTRAAAAAEMAGAEERAIVAEGQLGLQQTALYEAAEELPGSAVDVYNVNKQDAITLVTDILDSRDNWSVNSAMVDELLLEVGRIDDPFLRKAFTDKLNNLKQTPQIQGGGFINAGAQWTDADGNTQTLFDIDDSAYVDSLRQQDEETGGGGIVVPTGEANALD